MRLKSQRGLEFIHALVSDAGRSWHARELVLLGEVPARKTPSARSDDLTIADDGGLEIVDQTALRAYGARLNDLDGELAQAEEAADLGRLETLQAEREALLAAVQGATGLGGRLRKTGSDAERARTAVRKRIKAALDRIRRDLPSLHVHLSASLRTGVLCAYEPLALPTWQTTRPED